MPKSTDRVWLKDRNKAVTGFCNDHGKPAQCEGTRPKSGGKPLPVCPQYLVCPCECHQRVDEMFKMTGQERRLMPNPDYVPARATFVMPVVLDPITGRDASSPVDIITPDGVEHIVTPPAVVTKAPLVERRTPMGYAGRGTLEAQVWEACRELDGNPETKTVSEWIGPKYKIPNPSRGAIQAVWIRWEKLGFASWAKKPVRFIGFEHEGTWAELERIKASVKQKKKSTQTAIRTGRQRL